MGVEPALNLEALARLCYFANGITRVLRRQGLQMPFRAAACTGALYHIELYVVCAELTDLAAGVYHYSAHDNALRLLRRGDFRGVLSSATGGEPSVVQAPLTMVCTSTFWRNAWKYQARAYRHAFWDTGTIVANLLAVAAANDVAARVVLGFADAAVNALLDADPEQEAAICLVALGRGATPAPGAPPVEPLRLPTQPLSATHVDYPAIVMAHNASSLATADAVSAWRGTASRPPEPTADTVGSAPDAAPKPAFGKRMLPEEPPLNAQAAKAEQRGPSARSIEDVILRRGSARRFTPEPIEMDQLMDMLIAATRPMPADVAGLTQAYLIVNAVAGLASGAYVFHQARAHLELLKPGNFRQDAALLDLGQELAGQAAVNVYWLADLDVVISRLGSREYRAVQLEAAVEGGKLYLAAYAFGLGATGLTFFDDEVSRFFQVASKSVMFLIAVGHPAKPSG
jgi:SagB-type dehydrogenase family enzyme